MVLIKTQDMIRITSAEKNEFLISFSLFFPNLRSSPASNTIIISPTVPKISINLDGNSIDRPDVSATYRRPIPANSKSKTEGILM
jgi:hypothetical protein